MSLGTILVIVLIIALLGGFVPTRETPQGAWYHGYGYGLKSGGGLGLVLVIVLILLLLGRI